MRVLGRDAITATTVAFTWPGLARFPAFSIEDIQAHTAVSTIITSTNAVPVLVERSM
jgi:hypothetical protein